jgi:DNA replication factor GINS
MDVQALREIHRLERMHAKLQYIDRDFYDKVEETIKDFYSRYLELSEKGEITKASVLLRELENVKAIVNDIYEMRERKILLSALNYARRGEEPPMENLLDEEREMLSRITDQLKENRQKILDRLLALKPVKKEREIKQREKLKIPLVTVRILKDLPSIVGVDGKVYGSFKEEDIATLPEPNAEALINRGVAEKIRTD